MRRAYNSPGIITISGGKYRFVSRCRLNFHLHSCYVSL